MAGLHYDKLSSELDEKIRNEKESCSFISYAFNDSDCIRRKKRESDTANVVRTPFIRDIDKILHCPYYNRYTDKTQVFSFYRNDDITRRALHVQLVSRIARTIGKCLNLNLDLIEAIALGHDIGHTPFGHTGEKYLDKLYFEKSGRHFSHNIHSVRVLDQIFPLNISLQTLNGIASHDGELELKEYKPKALDSFDLFDKQIEECYIDKSNIKKLTPCTLEGCVMRISDIIAYLGKDRQDAIRARNISTDIFSKSAIGVENAEIINNLVVSIIENSYSKPYIKMSDIHFEALKLAKQENYDLIYLDKGMLEFMDSTVFPMMRDIYERLFDDLVKENKSSPIYKHHIDFLNSIHYERNTPYELCEKNQIVVDYIASMTDDYFIDLHKHLFPNSKYTIEYKSYFD
ncbi:MAG: HD domain-containing protein [Clostridia bacterium]|nr:HD domain-containing protein [Clostridia bacterium]